MCLNACLLGGLDCKLPVGGVESPPSPALTLLLSVGQSPDFQGIFHDAKDLLKTKEIQNQRHSKGTNFRERRFLLNFDVN